MENAHRVWRAPSSLAAGLPRRLAVWRFGAKIQFGKKGDSFSLDGGFVANETSTRANTERAMAGITGSTPVDTPRPPNSQISVVPTPMSIELTAPVAFARRQTSAATSEGVTPVP